MRLPDGAPPRFGDADATDVAPDVEIVRDELVPAAATRGRLALGESYAAGDWHADDLVGAARAAGRDPRRRATATRADASRGLGSAARGCPRADTRRRAERNIHYHYDLGNDLYGSSSTRR